MNNFIPKPSDSQLIALSTNSYEIQLFSISHFNFSLGILKQSPQF